MKAYLITAMMLAFGGATSAAQAQDRKEYDKDRNFIGWRSISNNGAAGCTITHYDAYGRATNRLSVDSTGTPSLFAADGRLIEKLPQPEPDASGSRMYLCAP